MGSICGAGLTAEEREQIQAQKLRNKAIEAQQKSSRNNDQQIKKLLLLGAGESGKSTLFKQMISLYGKGYPEQERMTYKTIVYQNTINAMQILLQHCEQFHATDDKISIEDNNRSRAQHILELGVDSDITGEIARDIEHLWSDAGIQATFDKRTRFQFPDSGPYFFDRVQQMITDDYIPDEQDVLRCRVRTTGIVETAFYIDGNQFRMFDVGGQRNERKKWIHCFENVTCVIFVAAISEYDQVLFEDETTNRVDEALNLFDEVCNSRWFEETSMILFLNKRDLFMDKIHKVQLSVYFNDYTGDESNYDQACEFFREKFEARNGFDKEIYTHVTCATDTDNISHVFDSVKDIIIKRSLKDGGLM